MIGMGPSINRPVQLLLRYRFRDSKALRAYVRGSIAAAKVFREKKRPNIIF